MSESRTLGPWLRRFLAEHIVTERNLARNTQLSYRDAFAPAAAVRQRQGTQAGRPARGGTTSRPGAFWSSSPTSRRKRGCSVQTRNPAPVGDPRLRPLRGQPRPRTPGVERGHPRDRREEGGAATDRLAHQVPR